MRGGETMAKERKAPRERKAPEGMPKNTGATLKRVVAYVMEHYKIHYICFHCYSPCLLERDTPITHAVNIVITYCGI